jgi:hypothetical protein
MAISDYGTEAELCSTESEVRLLPLVGGGCGSPPDTARAADAIRFAIEELPPEHLVAAQLS